MDQKKPLGVSSINKLDKQSQYNKILERLKEEFAVNWNGEKRAKTENLSKYKKIKTLGAGSFGKVILVVDNEEYFAMKCLSKEKIMSGSQFKQVLFERRILAAVRFPFLINLEFCFKDNSYIYFLLPFINGGDMWIILKRMRRFPEILSKFYAAQVVLALEYLHVCNIVHRDLKPDNILIDMQGYIKLADFGLSKKVKSRTWTLCGTLEYMAPELLLNKGYGTAVDWWSFGILIFEMNAGFLPFRSFNRLKLYSRITAGKYKFPVLFSIKLQNLIENTLQLDLSKRFGNLKNGTQDFKNHGWFEDVNFMSIFNRTIDPPFKPFVQSVQDTSNFECFDEEELRISEQNKFKEQFEIF